MKRVRREGTTGEDVVCKMLWSIGARYRRNVRGLAGTPDIANKTRRKAVFVHGCFWHHHENCTRGRVPRRNRAFWLDKLRRNVKRDREKTRLLQAQGYGVLVVWECELADPDALERRLAEFWFGKEQVSCKRLGT